MDHDEKAQRRSMGIKKFEEVTCMPCPEPADPLTAFTIDTIFAEIWTRPVLTRKERRWIALTAAAIGGQEIGVNVHVRSAVESGDITIEELQEFILHLGVYAGMPNIQVANAAVRRLAAEKA